MSLQDLMSDFVARVNNAITANNATVEVLKNNSVTEVIKKLTRIGYFASFEVQDRVLVITLNDKITKITRVSKPSQRLYYSYKELPKVIGGKGYNVLTTSKGILTNVEAKKEMVGGELLFQIY